MILRFDDVYTARWKGPWPPPDRLGLARGQITGMTAVFDPNDTAAEMIDWLEEVADLSWWVLVSHSMLDEDGEHVERGARYVREA